MRKVIVYYRDSMDHYAEEYQTGPYPGNLAKDVQRNLELMGCTEFRVVPHKEKAA